MFLGTVKFINEKLINNDSNFFKAFTESRKKIEKTLIDHKDLIATVLQKTTSRRRVDTYFDILNKIYEASKTNQKISQDNIVSWGGVVGKIIVGSEVQSTLEFSEETKSKTFIYNALKSAQKCPVCGGYLDSTKSVSYDHITRRRDGGKGNDSNCQMTHPYCNQSIKN